MNDYQWSRKCQVILDEAQQYHQLTRADKLNHLQKGNDNRLLYSNAIFIFQYFQKREDGIFL